MFNVMERQAGLPKGPAQHSKRFDVRWRAMWRSSRTVFLGSGCTLGPAGLNTTSLRFIVVAGELAEEIAGAGCLSFGGRLIGTAPISVRESLAQR